MRRRRSRQPSPRSSPRPRPNRLRPRASDDRVRLHAHHRIPDAERDADGIPVRPELVETAIPVIEEAPDIVRTDGWRSSGHGLCGPHPGPTTVLPDYEADALDR